MSNAVEVLTKMPPPNGWQGWPMGVQAAARLGVSMRRLRAIVETGNIVAHKCPDRTNRYNPEELEQLAKDLRAISRNNGDGDDDSSDPLDALDDERGSRQPQADLIKELTAGIRARDQQNLELHKLLVSSSKQTATVQEQLIKQMLERETMYQTTLTDNYKQREAYFNHQAEREIILSREKAREARRDQIWSVTKGHFEKLVEVAITKWGIPPAVLAKLEPAIQLLQTMHPDQLSVLVDSDFLTQEQQALIRKIVETAPPKDAAIARKVADAAQQILDAQKNAQTAAGSWANPTTVVDTTEPRKQESNA